MPPSFVNPDAVEETSTDPIPPPLTKKVQEINSQTTTKVNQEGYVNCPKSYELKLPYPERRNVEKRQDKDKVQLQKFWKMFKQLHFNISLADALILMPKYTKMLKDLCANKEKLKELANTREWNMLTKWICKDVLVPVGKFTLPADFVVVDYAPDENAYYSRRHFYDRMSFNWMFTDEKKLILRDGNESLTLNMQSEKSKLNGIQRVESINMIDIFNVPNYIGFKDLFAKMYSGSPTIQSDDSFPSSSPMKTSDSTFEEFTDKITLPNSLPPGDDVSILKKDFQEYTFRIISNPLFEFNDCFKSSNMSPLFEENDKDVEIKSSSSFTLTSPEVSKLEAYLAKDSIPPGIDLTLPPTFEVSSSNPTSPTLTGEKENEEEISSDVPIHTIVMPIRITFDNPIDFNNHFSKPKDLKKDLTISFDSTTKSSILPPPLLDSDSPFTAELSASVTLNSLGNEDKVFKPGILVYHAIHDKNLVTLEENLKENISSGTLLVFQNPSFFASARTQIKVDF
ncbi:hypothetical protein Tco_1492477 [Tanacetum coccineum]